MYTKGRGYTWSIISTDNGDTIMLMSFGSVSSGRLKTRVFPLPVPTSRITSCPHRIETQASNCHSKGFLPSNSTERWARRPRSTSCGLYCRTATCRGLTELLVAVVLDIFCSWGSTWRIKHIYFRKKWDLYWIGEREWRQAQRRALIISKKGMCWVWNSHVLPYGYVGPVSLGANYFPHIFFFSRFSVAP